MNVNDATYHAGIVFGHLGAKKTENEKGDDEQLINATKKLSFDTPKK